MTAFDATEIKSYWGLTNLSHKPSDTELASFSTNGQNEFEGIFGSAPVSTRKAEYRLAMLYILRFILFWFQGQQGFAESKSSMNSGSATLPSLKTVNEEIVKWEALVDGADVVPTGGAFEFGF
jgi:hypothetical protein